MSVSAGPRGVSWLYEATLHDSVFTPEKLSDEHRLIRRTADEFVANEVLPAVDRLEAKDWAFVRQLVRQCADLGLIGTDVPEEFNGLALDKVSSLIVSESVGRLPSWAVTFGGQTGLAITPLLCFGTAAQKQAYLPRLVSGETIGAYALSETGSGSDALGARCRAARQEDGSFILTGEKMWITNGGFADLFTVFAKADNDQFTAFLVERTSSGVTTGKEEHKLGLHGSSTVPLILQDVRVPAGGVLGEVGKGHKVAFNVLNYGRFKLAAMCSGGARFVIAESAQYASERRQFGRALGEFGAIRYKLAEMTVRQYAVESMLYRIAGLLDQAGAAGLQRLPEALEEFAVEASIVKVAGSEMLDYVVDENVQIHGGNGFVRDYPAERHYRDARVNRIFEGTNEINRMLIPGMIARREAARLASASASAETGAGTGFSRPVGAMKTAASIVLSTAVGQYGKALGEQQEVLMFAADVIIDTFASESVMLRAAASGDPLHATAAAVYINDAVGRVELAARNALAAIGDAGRARLTGLRALMNIEPVNTIPLRHQLAEAVLSRRKYPFVS
ncbi:MAG TPA: acyl-CoA dehydrogenase family protein [Vicinamibacterales bacterium]|nr:acyl-CoA dehydrogenase family protein [Vicinamibacterales bacterium]